ncbi:32928_t:CDS:1, partial [Gigaspora margarita]
ADISCDQFKQNGDDAEKLNQKFQDLTPDSPCKNGDKACINGAFAQCADNQFKLFPCGGGLKCVALPLLLNPGTSLTCDTEADKNQRIENAKNCV